MLLIPLDWFWTNKFWGLVTGILDLTLEYWSLYEICTVDKFLVDLGVSVNTIGGAISQAINTGFVIGVILVDISW